MTPRELARMKPSEILRTLESEYKHFLTIEDKQQAAEFAGGDDWDEANQIYQEEIAFWGKSEECEECEKCDEWDDHGFRNEADYMRYRYG